MASWMKWALALIAMCAAAGILIVRETPTQVARAEERLRITRQSELRQIQEQIRSTSRVLLQYAARDSVRHFLPDTPGVVLALRARLPERYTEPRRSANAPAIEPQLSDSARTVVEHAVAEELRKIGGSRARIALVALPGLLERVHPRAAMPVRYFAGQDSAGAWCAVVISAYSGDERDALVRLREGGSVLGPCRLWARYGAPGAAVNALLPRAGHLMVATTPSLPDPPAARRGLFGQRALLEPERSANLAAQGCLAGRESSCLPALLDENQWSGGFWLARVPDGPALLERAPMSPGTTPVEHLFADLEREMGNEAFARFWRSDADAAVALGESLEAGSARWLHDWARARYGAEPRGPGIDAATFALTLLGLALLLLAATSVARARRIA